MPLPAAPKLILSESERKQLLAFSRHRGTPKGILLRVNIILGAAEGIANHVLARSLETSLPTVLLWRRRFQSDGLAGILEDRPRSGWPKQIPEERETAIVEATMHTTPKDAAHWSIRSMATSQKGIRAVSGVKITVFKAALETLRPALQALAMSLLKEGIATEAGNNNEDESQNKNAIHVIVGSKPMNRPRQIRTLPNFCASRS